MNAANAVILHGGASRPAALSVGALKSVMGHAEPAAGAAGLLHLSFALQHRAEGAILHLRHLNPLVTAAIGGRGSSSSSATCVSLPRQVKPTGQAGDMVGGVSAFAFQVIFPFSFVGGMGFGEGVLRNSGSCIQHAALQGAPCSLPTPCRGCVP